MPALGPPPDPRLVPVPVGLLDDPAGHALCGLVALLLGMLALWRRPPQGLRLAAAVSAGTVALSSPWLAHLDRSWLGAFPTIDKEGSLLFYLDGVHWRTVLDPVAALADPAVQLIGVHTGHLWLVELADLVFSPVGAFGLWALLCPALAWLATSALLRELRVPPVLALAFGFPFGMGLHVFRDLNWYTIEKAMVFWLPLFALAWVRARQRGGHWLVGPALLWPLVAWMNLYFGLVLAIAAGTWSALELVRAPRSPEARRSLAAGLGCVLSGTPLVLWQHALMAGAPPLASPEAFLWQRAALDSVSLWPPAWNRLELWRALNPVAVVAALLGLPLLRDRRLWPLVGALALCLVLALGPALVPGPEGSPAEVGNPVYLAVRAVVPGFWRMAKPEVFAQLVWLGMLVLGASKARATRLKNAHQWAILGLVVASWLALVRTHPAFPGLSQPIESQLAPDWAERER